MGLFKRVGDIISANLNDMIDRFEDPEKMLNQAIREMETAIGNSMDSAARVMANGKLLEKQLANQQAQAERWQQRAMDAISSGDDDAARHALIRKKEQEKLSLALEHELTMTQSVGKKLRRLIEALNVKLAEARRKIVTLSVRKHSAQLHQELATSLNFTTVNENAFGRFDRLCEKIERAEVEAEALLELIGYEEAVVDVADTDIQIETELMKLKKHGTQ